MAVWWLSSSVLSQCFLAPLGVFFVMKTLEDERKGVITAYNLAVLEIQKFVCISVSALSLHIESTDSMIISASFPAMKSLQPSYSSILCVFCNTGMDRRLWTDTTAIAVTYELYLLGEHERAPLNRAQVRAHTVRSRVLAVSICHGCDIIRVEITS